MESESFRPHRDGRYAFVSYSHADRLAGFQYLEPLGIEGFHMWFDDGLTPCESWNDEMAGAIQDCTLFVLLVSPVSVERPEVAKEVRFARSKGKPILAIHLRATTLPTDLEFELGDLQAVLAHDMETEQVTEQIRNGFLTHGITQTEPTAPVGTTERPRRDRSGMPTKQRRQDQRPVTQAFADRVPESEAMRRSVARMRATLTGRLPVEEGVFPNVLVFHGGGGTGKSGLSQHLETWVSGGLPFDHHWGPWDGGANIPIRWDFNDSEGDVQFADMMRSLREALTQVRHQFLAFDLALAAYLDAFATNGVGLGLSAGAAEGVLGSLQTICARLRLGIPQALDPTTVRQLVPRVLRLRPEELVDDFDLADLLASCERAPSSGQAAQLAADLVYVLTQELYYLPEDERPLMVFFLDHFERLQHRFGHSHEPDIARLVAQLPFSLFVITGRDSLDWADAARTDLDHAGPRAWPGLADSSSPDPRQHVLERLSDEDTRRLYEHHRIANRWNMPDEVLDLLVERSDGLPIYISAVLKLAETLARQDPERLFAPEDLDGDLPEVVARLLSVLDDEERTAFRAASVLPFFDPELAAVVGQVSSGAVERAIRFALVEDNLDSIYPYRVHDVIREKVKLDRRSQGYWGDADWIAAANRGLAEAKRRITEAHQSNNDKAEIEAIVLGIRLAHEWNLTGTGLETSVEEAPSINALDPHLPKLSALSQPLNEAEALIGAIHAYSAPQAQGIDQFSKVAVNNQPAAALALLFGAYRLRSQGRFQEALDSLSELKARFPSKEELANHQVSVTWRIARQFKDALEYADEFVLSLSRKENLRVITERLHCDFKNDTPESRTARTTAQSSRRSLLELAGNNLLADVHQGRATLHEVLEHYDNALRRRQVPIIPTALRMLGYFVLLDESKLVKVVGRLYSLITDDGSNSPALTTLLALRALMTRDATDISVAVSSVPSGRVRNSAWIPVEIWLEELGHPLPEQPTQWLIPYEQVRANWLRVADTLIERAKAEPPWTPEMQEWWDARF